MSDYSPKLGRAVEQFLSQYIPTTALSYRYPLALLVDSLGEDSKLTAITSEMMLDYMTSVIRPRLYAPATLNKHIKTLHVFFNWCVTVGVYTTSPAAIIKARRAARQISRQKAMTDQELAAILDVLEHKSSPRDYAMVLFLADTGCRRGGLVRVRLGDLDLVKCVGVVTEKGDKTRPVAFSPRCAEAIRRWLSYRARHNTVAPDGDNVFSRDGKGMAANNVSLEIRRACKEAGIRVLSSHSLRHRKGHQFADARIAPSIAATALGHSDVMTTLTSYYPADWSTAEKALRELMTDRKTEAEAEQEQPSNILPFPGTRPA